MLLSAGHWQAAGWFWSEPVAVGGGAFEIALLDAGAAHAEVRTVAQHGEQDAAEPMGHGYHRGLVTAPCANPGEVRVQGMGGAARMMCRLAQHGAQLGRAALGDVAVGVALA